MKYEDLKNLPYMLYADSKGMVYEHPFFRMAGLSGASPAPLREEDLIPMPEFSKLFYIPGCAPIGLDPDTGRYEAVPELEVDGVPSKCYAVAAFLEPGLVRSHLPAVDYRPKSYILPTWAYTAVGSKDDRYWVSAFRIEHNHKWDPRNYDDRELISAIQKFRKDYPAGPLVEHLINCATSNHCFAAKNLFLKRWEAPLPVSQGCNAACLGCLSLQPNESCEASHHRITFRPSRKEAVSLAVRHLNNAPEAIVSFGQGCEGEPLTEYRFIGDTIRQIRKRTDKGTINLNTNGAWPERIRLLAQSGLDSIRISLNSAQPEFYRAYYRPRKYDFEDVLASIALSKEMGLYTMLNYLVFPGITDTEEEIEALRSLIRKTGVSFVHLKNLCIDPQIYVEEMPRVLSAPLGIRTVVALLREEFPDLELGYFNKPVR